MKIFLIFKNSNILNLLVISSTKENNIHYIYILTFKSIMSSNELKEYKKTLLKRVIKVPKSYLNDGKCEASEELDQNAHRIRIAVRKTKRKHQPIVIDVKFSPYDGH